jgi:DNA-binding transcriptional regulator YhcF (GntR family)
MGEKREKEYPFKITEYYSPGLNSLKRIYTQHPDFNGNVRLIYELLFDHWNPDYGYAFPTIWQLAEESGLGEATVKRCIKTLEKLDLIEKRRSSVAQNNIYIVKKPVRTIEELKAKFPEVEPYMNERIAKIKASEAASKARFAKKNPDAANDEHKEISVIANIATETAVSQEEIDLEDWF